MKKTVSFRVSDDMNRKLSWYAKRFKLPKSYLIRRAIDSFLSRLEKDEFRVFLSTLPEDEPLPNKVEVIEKYEKDLKEGKIE